MSLSNWFQFWDMYLERRLLDPIVVHVFSFLYSWKSGSSRWSKLISSPSTLPQVPYDACHEVALKRYLWNEWMSERGQQAIPHNAWILTLITLMGNVLVPKSWHKTHSQQQGDPFQFRELKNLVSTCISFHLSSESGSCFLFLEEIYSWAWYDKFEKEKQKQNRLCQKVSTGSFIGTCAWALVTAKQWTGLLES